MFHSFLLKLLLRDLLNPNSAVLNTDRVESDEPAWQKEKALTISLKYLAVFSH